MKSIFKPQLPIEIYTFWENLSTEEEEVNGEQLLWERGFLLSLAAFPSDSTNHAKHGRCWRD
jgi:hypothetical protein